MKQYQDHDPIRDQGKAEPHPRQPNGFHSNVSRFFTSKPHPDTVKEFRMKPSRKQRAEETQRRKSALRRAMSATRH